MSISKIIVLFMIYSFAGWLWEMVYTPFEFKYFENRGFFFGPICPIYGFCILFLQSLMKYVPFFTSESMSAVKLFFICMSVSTLVEYVTSWTLETFYHARWWDYSNFKLNVNGRICLAASIFWGLAGITLAYYIFPAVDVFVEVVPSCVFEIAALILVFIFGADFALTNASLNSLLEKIENANKEFTEKGESVYQAIAATPAQMKKRISDLDFEAWEKARSIAESLSSSQKQLMSRITGFSYNFGKDKNNKEKTNIGNKIKEYLSNIRHSSKEKN